MRMIRIAANVHLGHLVKEVFERVSCESTFVKAAHRPGCPERATDAEGTHRHVNKVRRTYHITRNIESCRQQTKTSDMQVQNDSCRSQNLSRASGITSSHLAVSIKKSSLGLGNISRQRFQLDFHLV